MSEKSTTTTWLTLAATEITNHNLNPELLQVLSAFGGSTNAPGPPTLNPDDNDDESNNNNNNSATSIATQISSTLTDEIDQDQSTMFSRRFISVSTLLSSSETENKTFALLRLALHRRAVQILNTPASIGGPRALRIRALVDFIWSQALVLGHASSRSHHPTLVQLVQTPGYISYDEFAPGLKHATLEGLTSDFGPCHINILRIQKGAACMECVDARQIIDEETGVVAPCTNLTRLAKQKNALAAISGGFFLYSEPDIDLPSKRTDPVGLLVNGGKIENPPVFRRAALLQNGDTGEMSVEKVGMEGVFVKIGEGRDAIGCRIGRNGVRFVHRGDCKSLELKNGDDDDEFAALSIVGRKVHRAIMMNDAQKKEKKKIEIDVPLNGFVLLLPLTYFQNGGSLENVEGADVSYTFSSEKSGVITSAMAGGPILLSSTHHADEALDLESEDFRGSAPPVTFSQDETFDRNLLPRMGAGVTADGELVLAAVDGRNLDRALGLTLRGTAALLEVLGCVRALNLDGGSSKRMVIRHGVHGHRVVCLSTTEIKAKVTEGGDGNVGGGEKEAKDEEEVEAVEDVGEDMEKHKEEKMESKSAAPELSRPVHSAILFLPPK